jgi:hypothetical protein
VREDGLDRLGAVVATLLAASAACAAVPPMFYQGSARTWTLPIVGPLENADLVVPVTIDGKGPYLFAVDPDTPLSKIDSRVAEELGLYRSPGEYARLLGADGISRPHPIFEIRTMHVGLDLSLRGFRAIGTEPGMLWFNGRRVAGVLGSNLFTRTIVMDIDRDAGLVRLALTGHERPPALGRAVKTRMSYYAMFVPVTIEGKALELQLHLGTRFCALWPRIAERVGAPFGRDVEKLRQLTASVPILFGPRPIAMSLAPGVEAHVAFTSLYDKLTSEVRLDGVLGHNFLARFRVLVDRDDGQLWFAPRDADLRWRAADRFARWGDAFAACAATGCVETVLVPAEGKPAPTLLVRRAAGVTADRYEAVLEALDATGRPLLAPLLRVAFDRGTRDVKVTDPRFAGILVNASSFRVVDLSPFAAECAGGCVDPVDRMPR